MSLIVHPAMLKLTFILQLLTAGFLQSLLVASQSGTNILSMHTTPSLTISQLTKSIDMFNVLKKDAF